MASTESQKKLSWSFNDTDLFVELESINEVDETGVIEVAAGEVELLQLACLPGPSVC